MGAPPQAKPARRTAKIRDNRPDAYWPPVQCCRHLPLPRRLR